MLVGRDANPLEGFIHRVPVKRVASYEGHAHNQAFFERTGHRDLFTPNHRGIRALLFDMYAVSEARQVLDQFPALKRLPA